MHTAPGHGADDFYTGQRYGLQIYTPVNHRGEFTDDVEHFAGMHVFKANPKIIELLRGRTALIHDEKITHSYPHCWRCKNPVIFRATEQWFISMDDKALRANALDEIKKVKWYPAWGEDRIRGMVENSPDWCISRQRLWGVPITVLYCEGCSEAVTSPELFAKVTEIFEREGADAWFDRPASDFYASACGKCGGDLVARVDDGVEIVRERLGVYQRQTKPLVDYYSARPTFRQIDGNMPPDVVTAAIDAALAAATARGVQL